MTIAKLARWAWIATAASFLLICSGCTGTATWISDALQIVPVASSMVAGIMSLIAALQGKSVSANDLTTVSNFATQVENGLKDLQQLIDAYKAEPAANLQQEIMNAADLVTQNIAKFLADVKIGDAALAQKVQAILTLVESQLQAWMQVIPALTAHVGAKVSFTVPMSAKAMRQAYNTVIHAPSGSADVDAALVHVKSL